MVQGRAGRAAHEALERGLVESEAAVGADRLRSRGERRRRHTGLGHASPEEDREHEESGYRQHGVRYPGVVKTIGGEKAGKHSPRG